jgi:mono/diheme cytochrome c family protein
MTTTRLGLVTASILALVLLLLGAMSAAASPTGAGDPAKGKYIMAINGGCGCHGPDHAGFKPGAPPDQSGSLFAGPFGTVTAKNITPDKDTGIGNWTDAQVTSAMTNGIDDQGKQLFPIMPYTSFHFMSNGDVADLVAYVRTLPAVKNDVPDNKLSGPVPPAPQLPPSPAAAPTGGVERGAYVANAISICGDCHTPSLPDGSPDMSRLLAGGVVQTGPTTSEIAPNLTPDNVTGLGTWTDAQIISVLKTGLEPGGDKVEGLMISQIMGTPLPGGGYSQYTAADAQAVAAYLRSLPPVSNVAATGAGFKQGFKTMSDLLPNIVGLPLDNEHRAPNGDTIQTTTSGLLAWRRADNITSFTNGATTWLNGPFGIQQRPNDQKFDWEH